jgi:hypothetical protein
MRNRKLSFLVGALLLMAIFAAYAWLRPKEPSFEGRPLNEWIRAYNDGKGAFSRTKIDQAVRAMGPNTIPFLVEWMRYEPLNRTGRLSRALSGLIKKYNPTWEHDRMVFAMGALSGLEALGPEGEAAVGALSKMVIGKNEAPGWRAAFALTRFGMVGIPPILSAMTNASPAVRKRVVKQCPSLWGNAWLAVPELIERRGDESDEVKAEATWALLTITKHAEVLLPGIMANLESPERWVRSAAMMSLTELPEFEANAVPGLQNALRNADFRIREEATNALRRRAELSRSALPTPKPKG